MNIVNEGPAPKTSPWGPGFIPVTSRVALAVGDPKLDPSGNKLLGNKLALMVLWRATSPYLATMTGIGWDQDNPLRPWPWLHWTRNQAGEVHGACLSWCGLYFTVRYQR